MKLLRLKITDPDGFRSLPCGFEQHFRTEWGLQDELAQSDGFAPFVCAGPNGSGKSNLLEVLAAIFYQLEVQRVRRSFLPEVLQNSDHNSSPVAFELEYLIRVPIEYRCLATQFPWTRVPRICVSPPRVRRLASTLHRVASLRPASVLPPWPSLASAAA